MILIFLIDEFSYTSEHFTMFSLLTISMLHFPPEYREEKLARSPQEVPQLLRIVTQEAIKVPLAPRIRIPPA